MRGWLIVGAVGVALVFLSTFNPFPPNPLDTVVYLAGLAGTAMAIVSAGVVVCELFRQWVRG